ncbi:hypothetical protein ACJMK2_020204 [Sinanodonta woodiana]|uniref:Uncharacterized protein n=1 Tax=Sinanodonta woodiana TaxID=1069815 RepID=A0ABD3U032_SINWO
MMKMFLNTGALSITIGEIEQNTNLTKSKGKTKRNHMENTTTNINTGGRVQQEPSTVAGRGRKKRQTQNTNNKTSGNHLNNVMGKNHIPDRQQRNGAGQMEEKKDRTQGGSSSMTDRQPTGETGTKQTVIQERQIQKRKKT